MSCQKCGKQIEEGSRFCPYCGAVNKPGSEQGKRATPVQVEKSQKKAVPALITAVLVLAVLGGMLLLQGNSGPDRGEKRSADRSSVREKVKESSLTTIRDSEENAEDAEDDTESGDSAEAANLMEKEEQLGDEELPEEGSQDLVTEPLTYGTYFYDDQKGTTGTADVGFYTDEEGGDYIYIECWRNDREIAYFEGLLEENSGNYHAYCKEMDSSIMVIFADGGLYVEISDSDVTDIEEMEGFYSLETALNFDEAG